MLRCICLPQRYSASNFGISEIVILTVLLKKTFTCFFIISALVIFGGCSSGGHSQRVIGSPEGMIGYLESEAIPSLRSAELWPWRSSPGIKITTDHYQVYTTLFDPLVLREVPGFVESLYVEYCSQLPSGIDMSVTVPLKIYLFSDRGQWSSFTDSFTGTDAPLYSGLKAGAYCARGACVAYFIGRDRTFMVLAHEGWHQFSGRYFACRPPSWLDEAAALSFECHHSVKGGYKFNPSLNANRLSGLRKAIDSGRMIPLNDLLELDPGRVIREYEEGTVRIYYGQLYALMRFLKQDYQAAWKKMMYDGFAGRWPLDENDRVMSNNRNLLRTVAWNRKVGRSLFISYVDSDIDEFEVLYNEYCRQITRHLEQRQ